MAEQLLRWRSLVLEVANADDAQAQAILGRRSIASSQKQHWTVSTDPA